MGLLVSTQAMNIVEAQKRAGYTKAAEFLAGLVQKNDLLQFAPWFESSDGAFHKWLHASRLGKGAFTQANSNVPAMSSGSDTKVEPLAIYEGDSTIDDRVLKTAKDRVKTRDSEDVANLEGFVQDWLYQLMYGVHITEGFKGLAARRANLDSKFTWGAGGSGSTCSSLWLFEFGDRGFNFRYPAGAQPGISSQDRGLNKVPIPEGSGQMWAWIRHFEIIAGMELKNEKALLRLANIASTGSAFDTASFIKMKNQLPSIGRDAMGFCNRTVHALIENEAYNKTNLSLSVKEMEGFGPIVRVAGVPVMFWESITDTETALTA